MRELTFDEIEMVAGSDGGDSAVAGMVAGGYVGYVAGSAAMASLEIAGATAVVFVGGAVLAGAAAGALIGYGVWYLFTHC